MKGIMALRFPRFSQGLAQEPTTRRIFIKKNVLETIVIFVLD